MQPLLPAVLSGDSREQARQDLDHAIIKALTHMASESMVAEAARVDPSLLLEPNRFPGLPFDAPNYLELARRKEWTDTLEVALEAGIHPDNREAFCGRTLLARRGDGPTSLPGPRLLGLALRYGAKASQRACDDSPKSLVRAYAAELQPLTSSSLVTVQAHLACLRQLLQTEPGPLDPQERDVTGAFIGDSFLVTLGSARILTTTLSVARPLAKEGFELLRLAAARGADINWRAHAWDLPPVWKLVNEGAARSAAVLIELGADPGLPKDAAVSNLTDGAASELAKHAETCEGKEGAAAITEAVMRRRIQTERLQAAVPVTPAEPAELDKPRRRRWLLGAL